MSIKSFFHGTGGDVGPKKLWRTDIAAIGIIIALLLISHTIATRAIRETTEDAEVINVSGYQRTLNQRMIFFAKRFYENGASADRQHLENALLSFEAAHQELSTSRHLGDANRGLYFKADARGTSLDDKVKSHLLAARTVLRGGDDALDALESMVRFGPNELHKDLDQAVTNFERHAQEQATFLARLQDIIVLAAIALMILERLYIFWPALRTVIKTLTNLKEQQVVLHRANVEANAKNTQLQRLQEQMQYDAFHDPLTGLANRRGLDQEITRRLKEPSDDCGLCLMHIDLDRFKAINDTLGHAAGDFILKWTADTLREILGSVGYAARIGGDEFVVVIDADQNDDDAAELANMIIQRLSEPVEYQTSLCHFGASIGIARDNDGTLDAERLLMHADIALYRAKQMGRGCFAVFNCAIKEEFDRTQSLCDDILIGVKKQQFLPFYQLQFDAQTLQVVGAEALVRWRHPIRGLLTPDAFLHTAFTLNAVKDIDHHLMLAASHDLRAFDALGAGIPKISLNISSQRLEDPTFIDQIRAADIDPERFTFELTETVRLDAMSDCAKASLDAISARGFEIEVDDFGTGHASILAVQNLRPRRIKIPRELIQTIRQDVDQRALVSTVIRMAHSLGAEVVAEGVEDQETGDILRAMGCNRLQGYFYARPVAPGELIELLRLRARTPAEKGLCTEDVKSLAA